MVKHNVVDCITVGKPAKKAKYQEESVKFIIHDFKNRITLGKAIVSPILKAYGYKWRVVVGHFEHGNRFKVAIISIEQSNLRGVCQFCLNGIVLNGIVVRSLSEADITCWSTDTREIEDESLEIVTEIKKLEVIKTRIVWYPKAFQQEDTLVRLFQDDSFVKADTTFSVSDMVYRAHKFILALRGNKLYEISKEYDNDRPVPIVSTRPEIFKILLHNVYTVKPPEPEDISDAIDLLEAADCYGFIHLKLYAESILTDKFLTVENAAELLVLGDSYSCALLKEEAMKLCVDNTDVVLKTKAWAQVRESGTLLDELLTNLKRSHVVDLEDLADFLSPVSLLRRELESTNLALDGSREVLLDRLKTYEQEAGEENK